MGILSTSFRALVRSLGLERTPILPQADLVRQLEGESAPLVLDVRTEAEFAAGHVPGALNIPLDELPGRLAELNAAKPMVVY